MNKTGLAALVALVGAGLITTKNFKSSFASETFMAQGKRAIALRDNRINQENLRWKYNDQWNVLTYQTKNYIPFFTVLPLVV